MKKVFLTTLKIAGGLYILICIVLFFFQERLIFFPEKLPKGYKFDFHQKFVEIGIKTRDNKLLSGVLFPADSSKGLIFYLHGNAGSIRSWGKVAKTYTDLDYDVFMLDYRGHGKSGGSINGESLFFEDIQTVYEELEKKYREE